MSIFGALFSAVSGLSADSQALGMIADNISNSNTPAYKETSALFSTLVTQSPSETTYTPGGVRSQPFTAISAQGLLQGTSSPTDLAIQGGGFFVVNNTANSQSPSGSFTFTRAGSFTVDASGNLKNTAGLFLQGQKLTAAEATAIQAGNISQLTATSLSSLQTVNINGLSGAAQPTANVMLAANLPAGDTPASAPHTVTVPTFDSLGNEHDLTLSFSRVVGTPAVPSSADFTVPGTAVGGNNLTVTVDGTPLTINNITATAGVGNPLTATDVATAVQTALSAAGSPLNTLTATVVAGKVRITDPSGSTLTANINDTTTSTSFASAGTVAGSPALGVPNQWQVSGSLANAGTSTVSITPGDNIVQFNSDGTINLAGSSFATAGALSINWDPQVTGATSPQPITFNLGNNGSANGLTQFGSPFSVTAINQDGLRFGNFTGISIDQNGIVTANFDNGQSTPIYMIPLATFANANGLAPETGNTYLQTNVSGTFQLRQAGTGSAGLVAPSSLENSTVDIATEFSNLIITQRAYEANAKIITTSDQMLQTLVDAVR